MHLVVADRLLDVFHIQSPGYFYCGNLAPDAIMARVNYVREMKRHTHFKDHISLHELRNPEKFADYRKRLDRFYETYCNPDDKHYEIYFGYVVHMLVDELYILKFRDHYVDELVARGKAPNDEVFFRQFGKDVDQVDWELVKTYSFRNSMPDSLLLQERYEIPGYITSPELLESKNYIIKKNFHDLHEKKPLQCMSMEENLAFIDLCVKEIPLMLEARYKIKF